MAIIRRCPYCNSVWVCYNWIHAFGGDRKAYEAANPHINPKDLKDWGHECWDCEAAIETYHKVQNGMPYWFLKWFWSLKDKIVHSPRIERNQVSAFIRRHSINL